MLELKFSIYYKAAKSLFSVQSQAFSTEPVINDQTQVRCLYLEEEINNKAVA